MKRILIVNNNMHIGGVQKALLNLLQTLHADYDITLLLFYRGGALLNEVPSDVRVCAADGAFRYFGMTKNDVSTVRDRLLRTFGQVRRACLECPSAHGSPACCNAHTGV